MKALRWKLTIGLLILLTVSGFGVSVKYATPMHLPITPQAILPETSVEFRWCWDQSSPLAGRPGPGVADFRDEFPLDLGAASVPLIAQVLLSGDDDIELYVKRPSVEHHDHNWANDLYLVDFTSALSGAEHVLAIQGRDGWDDIRDRDRFYERVLFDKDIPTTPEPTTLVLLAIGLAGLGFMRWRHKKS
jgi:hypothetical protein